MSDRETLLQNVFDTISNGIFVVLVETLDHSPEPSITFRFVMANPAYVKMLSVPLNTLVGSRPHDCLPSDIADRFCTNYSRCLEQRQPIHYQESFEAEDERCTYTTTLSPMLEADGRISHMLIEEVLVCRESRLVYKVQDGIPVMLIEEAEPLDDAVYPPNT